MTWNTLHEKAHKLGFEVACQTPSPEGRDRSWLRVGSLDQMAGLWAHPVTEDARTLPSDRVVALISGCSEFVGTLTDYDADFFSALAPQLAAVSHPEYGRMPA